MELQTSEAKFARSPQAAVQTLKGFRDIDPEEALKRGRVLSLLKSVFKTYGFTPLETPTLEYASVLEGKYGAEADKLIYKFKDRGGREAALRYDLTVPLSRYIAQNKGKLTFPFKRYQIGDVFRAEKPQAGRYREFTQVDVDTVGIDTALADAEIIGVLATCLQLLGIEKFEIRINDREIFQDLPVKAIRILDKLDKIGREAVESELKKAGFGSEVLKKVESQKPTPRLQEIFSALGYFGLDKSSFRFDPLLARGLDYYTGMIYEIEITGEGGSISGGGRYNRLIGVPAVGGSFGLDRLTAAVPEKTFENIPFQPKVLVTIFAPELIQSALTVFSLLQAQGVEAEIYLDPNAKLDKQLKYADRKGISYAVILGPQEIKEKKVILKDLKNRTQQSVSLETLPHALSA